MRIREESEKPIRVAMKSLGYIALIKRPGKNTPQRGALSSKAIGAGQHPNLDSRRKESDAADSAGRIRDGAKASAGIRTTHRA